MTEADTVQDDAELLEAADDYAGNWQRMECFAWFRRDEIPDAEKWAVVYTHHRDSRLLDQSNAEAIEKALQPFCEADTDDPDCVAESHSHWAVGHVDGYSIRVFRPDGTITEAFRTYYGLQQQLADYPILDEENYSEREYEATIENIREVGGYLDRQSWDGIELPEQWEYAVYDWLSGHDSGEIENRDDQGGYPSEKSVMAAFVALGWVEESEPEE